MGTNGSLACTDTANASDEMESAVVVILLIGTVLCSKWTVANMSNDAFSLKQQRSIPRRLLKDSFRMNQSGGLLLLGINLQCAHAQLGGDKRDLAQEESPIRSCCLACFLRGELGFVCFLLGLATVIYVAVSKRFNRPLCEVVFHCTHVLLRICAVELLIAASVLEYRASTTVGTGILFTEFFYHIFKTMFISCLQSLRSSDQPFHVANAVAVICTWAMIPIELLHLDSPLRWRAKVLLCLSTIQLASCLEAANARKHVLSRF